jgi:Flp pilus assembly pilin Flp
MAHTELAPRFVPRILNPDVAASDVEYQYFKESNMLELYKQLWRDEDGQDIAEYAVMLAVILVIVIGTVRLIGSNANNVFSQVANQISTAN